MCSVLKRTLIYTIAHYVIRHEDINKRSKHFDNKFIQNQSLSLRSWRSSEEIRCIHCGMAASDVHGAQCKSIYTIAHYVIRHEGIKKRPKNFDNKFIQNQSLS